MLPEGLPDSGDPVAKFLKTSMLTHFLLIYFTIYKISLLIF